MKRKTRIGRFAYYIIYRVVSSLENILIENMSPQKLIPHSEGESVTVSLTTYPDRIQRVEYTIKSIMVQTLRPNRVVLWLSEQQFPKHKLPESLEHLKDFGLEVFFCSDDLRSHKKYYYALQTQKPDELVITIDDDIIYHPKTIERAVSKHRSFPKAVVCNSAHVVTFDKIGRPLPYSKWRGVEDNVCYDDKILTPLTGSGCLYPYGVLPPIAFDVDLMKSIAFTADDLWIAAMINISNIVLKPTDIVARVFTTVSGSQTSHLGQINCIEDGNDTVIHNLCKAFPQFLS